MQPISLLEMKKGLSPFLAQDAKGSGRFFILEKNGLIPVQPLVNLSAKDMCKLANPKKAVSVFRDGSDGNCLIIVNPRVLTDAQVTIHSYTPGGEKDGWSAHKHKVKDGSIFSLSGQKVTNGKNGAPYQGNYAVITGLKGKNPYSTTVYFAP